MTDQPLKLQGTISVEEAETLLQQLTATPHPMVDLSTLHHPHAAILQILAAVKPRVVAWPADPALEAWLRPLLGEAT
ncbi:MAG: hypothetical protein N2557_06990 [Hydrogenophilus sp.]|nr:hypothetical protein [Hydrogenophilus sp.]